MFFLQDGMKIRNVAAINQKSCMNLKGEHECTRCLIMTSLCERGTLVVLEASLKSFQNAQT